MKWRVLVLGASGFIGEACARSLAAHGHEVIGVGRQTDAPFSGMDYRSIDCGASSLRRLVADCAPDLCVNAAGSGNPSASVRAPAADFEANTALVQRTLEALRLDAPNCRYVGISSAAVYGDNPALPWAESAHPSPRSPYGYHKLCAELLTEEYHRLHGLATLSLRAFSVYGPGLRKQLFWDLFQRSRGATELTLFGSGRETRDYIHVDDVAEAISTVATHALFAGEALNLASGQPTAVAAACALLLEALGWQGAHQFSGDELPGSPQRMEADMTRTFALGFRPRIGLEAGLRGTAAWLLKS
jgi:nucleoside-diphosphate-sugar epimerase